MPAKLTDTEKKIKAAVSLLERHGYTLTPPEKPVVIDTFELNRRKLEPRRQAFIKGLGKYQGLYSNDMLNDFYAYWTEPNKSLTKMRFELQPTFDICRRLKTWARNNFNKYDRQQPPKQDAASKLADILFG